MKSDYTHISVILDRSGSMESIRDDTIGGFNGFLKDQKSQPGEATLTLVQFDSQDPYEVVHQFMRIQDIPDLNRETFVPRGGTPLLDALGRGINDLEKSIAGMKEGERPSKVLFAIITDGQENESREFSKDQIVKMIKKRRETDQWQFAFLSADLNAIDDAMSYGIQPQATLAFKRTAKGAAGAWAALSSRTTDFRSAKKKKIGFDLGGGGKKPNEAPSKKDRKR